MPTVTNDKTSKGDGDGGNGGGKRSAASSKKSGPVPKKKKHQVTLFGSGINKIDKAPLLLNESTLFTDAIYGKKVPDEHKGQLFLYFVKGYDAESKEFTVKYRNSMIREDGVHWVNQDGDRAEMSGVKIGTIEAGIEMYLRAVGRIAEHEKEEELVAEGSLKKRATVLTPEEVDTTDLDEASIINVDKGWMSQEVLDASALLWLFFIFDVCLYLTTF